MQTERCQLAHVMKTLIHVSTSGLSLEGSVGSTAWVVHYIVEHKMCGCAFVLTERDGQPNRMESCVELMVGSEVVGDIVGGMVWSVVVGDVVGEMVESEVVDLFHWQYCRVRGGRRTGRRRNEVRGGWR